MNRKVNIMSKRGELAVERKHNGYNCAQAVACTYADYVDIDEETLYALNQGFGGGLGSLDGHCGCLSGAAVVLSLQGEDKVKTVGDMREITKNFKERNSSIICRELKGVDNGKPLRRCEDCVRDVCEFLEEHLDI